MPAKNSTLKNGPRYVTCTKELYKRFIEETKQQITYKEFTTIINTSNEVIKNICLNNTQGFKMPENLGHMAISRYKPKIGVRSIDWKRSKETGVRVYHTNFHSFGYKARISWYIDSLSKCGNLEVYKFIPERFFSREVATYILAGKVYNELCYDDLRVTKIRLSKTIRDGI